MIHKLKYIAVILLSTLLINNASFAQFQSNDSTSAPQRPKIGLVLSGGGAKGLAHVGVLKAIDKAGLKIDYITGTSMGAIIAAMYASGYSGEEIGKIAQGMDWTGSILGNVNYHNISIENKNEFESYMFEVPVEDYIHLQPFSSGVIEPIEVALKFSEVFFPVYKTTDFSQLQIPFKCIATDLRNGDAVILDKGDLPFAVRSSMAIPGAFSATSYNGTKLVDGGIVRNFPVKDVRDMGAEFVIGVNLFQGLTDPNDLTNPMDVMMQATNFRDASDLIEEKSICDMVIEPDVSKFNAASFGSAAEIVGIGDSIGYDFYPLFKQLADSLHNAYGMDYINPNTRMKPYDRKVYIEDLVVEGLKHTDKELFLHNLQMKTHASYTPVQLNEAFRHAFSSGYYSNLRYELVPVDTATNHINLRCLVTENPMQSLNVGLSYNTYTGAGLILGYTAKNLLGRQSVTNLKVAISETFRVRFNNRVTFGNKYNNYLEQQYSFSTFEIPVYDKKTKASVYRWNHNDIHVKWAQILNPFTEVSATLGFEASHLRPDVSNPIDSRVRNIYFKVNRHKNTTDRKYLPTSGVNLETEVYAGFFPRYKTEMPKISYPVAYYPQLKNNDSPDVSSAEEESEDDNSGFPIIINPSNLNSELPRDHIYRISFHGQFFQPITKRSTLHETIALNASYQDYSLTHRAMLGGVQRILPNHVGFYGFTSGQRHVSTLAMARLSYQYRVIDELYATLHWNSAVTFESIDQYFGEDRLSFKPKEILHGVGLTASYNLSRMPFDLTLMYSPDYKFNIHVNIGFLF